MHDCPSPLLGEAKSSRRLVTRSAGEGNSGWLDPFILNFNLVGNWPACSYCEMSCSEPPYYAILYLLYPAPITNWPACSSNHILPLFRESSSSNLSFRAKRSKSICFLKNARLLLQTRTWTPPPFNCSRPACGRGKNKGGEISVHQQTPG